MKLRFSPIVVSAVTGLLLAGANAANADRYSSTHHLLNLGSANPSGSTVSSRNDRMPFAGRYADRPRHRQSGAEVTAEFAVMDVGMTENIRADRKVYQYGGRFSDHLRR